MSIIVGNNRDILDVPVDDLWVALAKGRIPDKLRNTRVYQAALQAIRVDDPISIQSTLESLEISQQRIFILELLTAHASTVANKKYMAIMQAFFTTFPDIRRFIIDHGTQGHSINLPGIEILVEHLAKKKSITLPCSLCSSYNEMINVINCFSSASSSEDKSTIIVQSDSSTHMMPIYLEKKDGIVHIVITDSKGCKDFRAGNYTYSLNVAKSIRVKQHFFCKFDQNLFSPLHLFLT